MRTAAAASTLIQGDHKQPSMPSTTSTTTGQSNLSHRVSGLAQGSGRGRVFNQIKAVSCVLRSFYLAKLFGLSQIHSSCPAPSTAPCSLLPACLPACPPACLLPVPVRFRDLSFSQSVGLSVGRSFSYASQNCLQLGIPYTYSHF